MLPRICSLPHQSRRGFTLIELLTVIAIVGVLAAILIPVLSGVKTRASSAQCSSQIRQIGAAFQMYLQDNNNLLPTSHLGTPFSGQGPYYNRDPRRIQTLFGSYLDVPASDTWSTSEDKMTYDATLAWSGWSANRRGPGPSLIGNWPVKLTNSEDYASQPPWGKSYLLLQDPSKAPMYTEADAVLVPTAGWSKFLPEKPVHGNYRNTLFFDGHVEQIDVSVDLRAVN
nr:prepilin-type N-terminal cleavage/methylation domain-containing protein [Cerasicoccus sp. TK19100]